MERADQESPSSKSVLQDEFQPGLMSLLIWAVSSALAMSFLAEAFGGFNGIYHHLFNYLILHYEAGLSVLSVLAYVVVSCISIITSIKLLRRASGGHVYVLWYFFFLLMYAGIAIYLYLDAIGLIEMVAPIGTIRVKSDVANTFWGHLLTWYLHVSTDVRDELILLSVIMSVVLVPQFLAFLVSGLSGCGRAPLLVSRVTQFSVLSLVKFFCIFAALRASEYLYQLFAFGRQGHHPDIVMPTIDYRLSDCLLLLAASFSVCTAYELSGRVLGLLSDKRLTARLNDVWAFMTEFSPQVEETEAEREEREKLETYQDIVDIGLLVASLVSLIYRNARRAAGSTDSVSEAISIFLRLFEKSTANSYVVSIAKLIAALITVRARAGGR